MKKDSMQAIIYPIINEENYKSRILNENILFRENIPDEELFPIRV